MHVSPWTSFEHLTQFRYSYIILSPANGYLYLGLIHVIQPIHTYFANPVKSIDRSTITRMTHWPIATHQKLTIASILPYRKFIKWREKSFDYFCQIISISTSFDLIWLAHIICWFIISSFNTPLSTEIIMKIHIRSISGQYTDRIDWFVKKTIIKSKVYDSDWMYTILTKLKSMKVNVHD